MVCIVLLPKKMRKLGYFVLQRIVKKSLRFMKGKMNALYYINQEVLITPAIEVLISLFDPF